MSASATAAGKRAFDLTAAIGALIVTAPVLAIVWLLVVATSPGPAIYASVRVGRGGRCFVMPKFRTLHVGAPQCARELLNARLVHYTPIGQFLRRSGLDELPQLFSILAGDMSFIGPRPLLENDPAAIQRAKFSAALRVRPGISGLAQVSGRNMVSPRRKARLDAFYARKLSLGLDLMLIARTVAVVASGRGFT